jgi:hypothetical protein
MIINPFGDRLIGEVAFFVVSVRILLLLIVRLLDFSDNTLFQYPSKTFS